MRTGTGRFSGQRVLAGALLLGVVLAWGCDLALEADHVPTEMVIAPDQERIVAGEPTQLVVIVKDQEDRVVSVPSWVPTVWTVSDGSAQVSPDGTLSATGDGWVGVSARVAELTAEARYCVSPARARLTAPHIFMTQAAGGPSSKAPLVAGRPALLRIFLLAQRANDFETEVQVSLVQGEDVVFDQLVVREEGIPNHFDESDLDGSVNIEIPGSALQPGVGLVVTIDPKCKAPLDPGSVTRYPKTGSTELRVVKPQLFRQVFVPTLWTEGRDDRLFSWLDGINPGSEQMRYTRNLLPVAEMEVEVRDTFRTNADLRTFPGWSQWLNEISALNISEGRRAYYYGVIGSSPTGVLGLAQFAVPWSVGVAESGTYTHEVGHNMNLRHAPCGGAGGPDSLFPYSEGGIGIWGYDVEKGVLYDPDDFKDVMSYCDPIWISDYQFNLAAAHRMDGDAGVDLSGGSSAGRAEMLVVWGSVLGGELKLDPAFVVEGPVALPEKDGPYRVDGIGVDGDIEFSLSFTPVALEHGGSSFVHFVPWDPEWATTLDRMVFTGPEGEYTVTRDGEPEMAVVTDPSTGLIQAIIRNWDGGPLPGEESGRVTITRGIPADGAR